jgi:hypothetical protein
MMIDVLVAERNHCGMGVFAMAVHSGFWLSLRAAAVTTVILGGVLPLSAGTIGVAVSGIGSTTQVGSTENRPLLGGQAIKYFITLGNDNGTYGVGSNCSGSGFGTCADQGDGGGTLKMYLRFDPVSTSSPSTLTIKFEDLDLSGANDPTGFLESINVLTSNFTSLTGGWITSIGGLITNFGPNLTDTQQILNLPLGILPDDEFYLLLKFRSDSDFYGKNTVEYLRAEITAVPLGPIPLPLTLALLLGGLWAWKRRFAAA